MGDPDPIPGTPPTPTVTATIEGTNATITWNTEPGDTPIEAWTYHFVRHVTDDHIEFTHLHLPAQNRTRHENNLAPRPLHRLGTRPQCPRPRSMG